MLKEVAESLVNRLGKDLDIAVVLSEPAAVNDAAVPSAGGTTSKAIAPALPAGAYLALHWLGARDFSHRRTASAYARNAVELSGKLEYLVVALNSNVLESHQLFERLLCVCIVAGFEYATVDVLDPCWKAMSLSARPALKLSVNVVLDVPIAADGAAPVKQVILRGKITDLTPSEIAVVATARAESKG